MRPRRFRQIDVFTARPYLGNPLAVVLDAEDLSADEMQSFARWTNLSETTFLLPPTDAQADYRVAIYTPGGELAFAGHPTLGSCFAWLHAGGAARSGTEIVQQCGVGLVRIRRDGERLAFAAPALRRGVVEGAVLDAVLKALGTSVSSVQATQWVDNGTRWVAILLDDAGTVLSLEPDHAVLKELPKVGVIGPYAAGGECAFEVRAFAASIGIAEDPVTGGLNASLAQWLIDDGLASARYVVAQGTRLGRSGRVYIESLGGQVWVGGSSVVCVEGSVTL